MKRRLRRRQPCLTLVLSQRVGQLSRIWYRTRTDGVLFVYHCDSTLQGCVPFKTQVRPICLLLGSTEILFWKVDRDTIDALWTLASSVPCSCFTFNDFIDPRAHPYHIVTVGNGMWYVVKHECWTSSGSPQCWISPDFADTKQQNFFSWQRLRTLLLVVSSLSCCFCSFVPAPLALSSIFLQIVKRDIAVSELGCCVNISL